MQRNVLIWGYSPALDLAWVNLDAGLLDSDKLLHSILVLLHRLNFFDLSMASESYFSPLLQLIW